MGGATPWLVLVARPASLCVEFFIPAFTPVPPFSLSFSHLLSPLFLSLVFPLSLSSAFIHRDVTARLFRFCLPREPLELAVRKGEARSAMSEVPAKAEENEAFLSSTLCIDPLSEPRSRFFLGPIRSSPPRVSVTAVDLHAAPDISGDTLSRTHSRSKDWNRRDVIILS